MLKYNGISVEPWSWKGGSPDNGSAAGASLVERSVLEINLQFWIWWRDPSWRLTCRFGHGGITPGDLGTRMESVDRVRLCRQGIWKVMQRINSLEDFL